MAEITSDTYTAIIADGNSDVINLKPGMTYLVKFWGTWQTTTLTLQSLMSDGTYEGFDDTDTAGIDGTTSEFQIVMPSTVLRIVAANTGTAPDINYIVHPVGL